MNTIWVGSLRCLQIVLRMQSVLVIQADAQANKITLRIMFRFNLSKKERRAQFESWALGTRSVLYLFKSSPAARLAA